MNTWKEKACARVDEIADQLVAVSRDIYDHPELKFEEFRASKLLAEKLQDAGFSARLGVAGLETAIQADHPAVSDGPTVAILGEYDALPEIGHACGHNLIAPDYRGSTGYGEKFHKLIDYGGLDVEDTFAARNWMVETSPLVDPTRVGIIGWSHGGLHTLMNIFHHPDAYQVAYACVPVSDLIARMGYKGQHYRDLYSAEYHIGKTAYENVDEYRRRSPAWHTDKLNTPLLIHTTTNDQDANVLEVEHLISALKGANTKFEYKIHDAAPGGHAFDRLDTPFAKQSRKEVYAFLAKYLDPPHPISCESLRSVGDQATAAKEGGLQ